MYARITPFKMKPGSTDAATQLMNSLRSDIMGLPGMKHFINVMNEDGSGYVVSLIESKEISDGNAERVRQIWGNFAEHLEAMPTPEGYDVIAEWSK
jgi:hypothetical protein